MTRSDPSRSRSQLNHWVRIGGAMGGFIALKMIVGFALVAASAHHLPIEGFVTFSQLFLFFTLLSTLSAAGVQNGVVRQIAAASGDPARERLTTVAALIVWIVFAAGVTGLTALARQPISQLLVGDASIAQAIPAVSALALAGGAGQICCAILTARGRVPTSLLLQSIGIAVGGGACVARLLSGDAVGAVIAYAAGVLVTTLLALSVSGRLRAHPGPLVSRLAGEIRLLLAFSGAFVVTATLMPGTLFGLRYVYQLEFGAEALGYWLAANRVSDVTSQLLGLYMAQVFLPMLARAPDPRMRVREIKLTFVLATLVMATGWLVFLVGAGFFVSFFLSSQFLPATPFIAGYLAGDVLRVSASMALHAALARGRFGLYMAVEASTAALLALLVLGLATTGRPESAYWGYIAAYAIMAGIIWVTALRAGLVDIKAERSRHSLILPEDGSQESR